MTSAPPVIPVNSGNTLSLSLPTDIFGGSGSGLNLNFNLGPGADTIATNAYGFVASQAAGAMGFEGQSIKGTQDFLTGAVAPILQSVATESDQYYTQLLGASNQATNVENQIAQNTINAQTQISQNSINTSGDAQGGGSIFSAIFGGCFITTAVCKYSGLPDDCHDLQVMRHWRDTWMRATPERSAMVDAYYQEAPKIVEALEGKTEAYRRKVYTELRCLIGGAVHHASRGSNKLALSYYLAAVAFARTAAEPAP